jgi:hypothetical protein
MRLPAPGFTHTTVSEILGENYSIPIVNSFTQTEFIWTLEQWNDYINTPVKQRTQVNKNINI